MCVPLFIQQTFLTAKFTGKFHNLRTLQINHEGDHEYIYSDHLLTKILLLEIEFLRGGGSVNYFGKVYYIDFLTRLYFTAFFHTIINIIIL